MLTKQSLLITGFFCAAGRRREREKREREKQIGFFSSFADVSKHERKTRFSFLLFFAPPRGQRSAPTNNQTALRSSIRRRRRDEGILTIHHHSYMGMGQARRSLLDIGFF